MKGWLQLTMFAWVTAVFAVAPVQAALTCRACCFSSSHSPQAKAATRHCCAPHGSSASCCVTGRKVDENRSPAPNCPRCTQARPLPSTTVPERLQLPELVAVGVQLPLAIHAVLLQDVSPFIGTSLIVSSTPHRCAVLCRWLT